DAVALPLPRWASFGAVALINLASGAALTATGARRARGEVQILKGTREELFRDKAAVGSLADAAPFLAAGAPGGAASRAPRRSGREERWQRRPGIPPRFARESSGRGRRSSGRWPRFARKCRRRWIGGGTCA